MAVLLKYFVRSASCYGRKIESKQYFAPSSIAVTPKLDKAPAVDATMMAPRTIWAIPRRKTVTLFQNDTFFFYLTLITGSGKK